MRSALIALVAAFFAGTAHAQPKNPTVVIAVAPAGILIPGLWDMHVHAAWPGLDALFAPHQVVPFGDAARLRP
jgi:hypothetical protein